MKKIYSKPYIVFDSFTLSASIAGGCERKTNLQGQNECGVEWGHSIIFTNPVHGCKSVVADNSDKYDGLCYHNPYESNNVFNS